MPRHSQSSQSQYSQSQRSQSQRLQSQRSQSQGTSENRQLTLEESFPGTNENIDEQVADLIRYIINRSGQQNLYKKVDIKKHVLPKSGSNFQTIIDNARNILNNVYGLKLITVEGQQNAAKSYIVSNSLSYIEDSLQQRDAENCPDDVHKILLLLILSHIFMSNNIVSEASLSSFLKSFKIDLERKHELFGNVKDYIFSTLKSKKYLDIETDQMSKKVTFSWGPRSEKEISKHDILNFVCKIYKDRVPSLWSNQLRSAEEQQGQMS